MSQREQAASPDAPLSGGRGLARAARWRLLAGALALAALSAGPCLLAPTQAKAQSLFDWERDAWDSDRRGREQDRRSRSQRRGDYCRKLEQRLVQEWRQGNQARGEIPAIRKELRQAEEKLQAAQQKAERRQCYEESFFFGRTLRSTPECAELDRDVQRARRDVQSLRDRIDRASRSGSAQSRQDELIAELARHGCGEDYERQYEARRPSFFSFFDDRSSFREPRRRSQSDLPFSTYRTMCVRRCDGYYFPVSFSTLPSQFQADETQCRERCAAPTRLFVYRNPGEDVEQMVSLEGNPYTELKNAWLYRKKFIEGCSCDAAEYSEADIQQAMAELDDVRGTAGQGDLLKEDEKASGARESQDRQTASDKAGEDGPVIRDTPKRDSFDPRRR